MAEIKEKKEFKIVSDSDIWEKIAAFFEHNTWALSGNKVIEGYFEIDNPYFRGFYIFNSANVGSFYILAILSEEMDKICFEFTLKSIVRMMKREGWKKITAPLSEVMDQMDLFGNRGVIPYLAFVKDNKYLVICKKFRTTSGLEKGYISSIQTKTTK